jgi:hypothetical protein
LQAAALVGRLTMVSWIWLPGAMVSVMAVLP